MSSQGKDLRIFAVKRPFLRGGPTEPPPQYISVEKYVSTDRVKLGLIGVQKCALFAYFHKRLTTFMVKKCQNFVIFSTFKP